MGFWEERVETLHLNAVLTEEVSSWIRRDHNSFLHLLSFQKPQFWYLLAVWTWLAVISICSDDWLIVRMKIRPFDNDTEVKIGDINLGDGCPVTRMLSFNYEFSYPVISCGINKFVFSGDDVFILSKINYRPTLNITYSFQVVCFVKRFQLSLMPFGMNGYDANMLGDSFEVTKERPPMSAPPQSKECEPIFSSHSKEQLFMKPWIKNVCIKTSSPP
uniref:oocyte-secreted protein 4B n=1 Tax=Ictidomys tridecemlineatus TaxID=43179 RepID=UPI001A9EA3D3|nr:oocyte-secreted protein 4B [Ictidomys tridecemlineatus]